MGYFKARSVNRYLLKHAFFQPQITTTPEENLEVVVVIPGFNEPDILGILNSLADCDAPHCSVEILVVINSGENPDHEVLQMNEGRKNDVRKFSADLKIDWLRCYMIEADDLPKRHAGVGLARKIGMDEAVNRFETVNNHDGIILNVDADCKVDKTYFTEARRIFRDNPENKSGVFYYEHPVNGPESAELYQAIVSYELYLRYYITGLRFAGYPFAYQTLGSCMAVRSSVYQSQGGMNRRKAGEDFYFLHKLMPLGGFVEINGTCVRPSPRVSDRVPFGTGKAVGDYLSTQPEHYPVYAPETFVELKQLFETLNELQLEDLQPDIKLKKSISEIGDYLQHINFTQALAEMRTNCTTQRSFSKRLWSWFDGLKVLKLVHHLRDSKFQATAILDAANEIASMNAKTTFTPCSDEQALLNFYRNNDRNHSYKSSIS